MYLFSLTIYSVAPAPPEKIDAHQVSRIFSKVLAGTAMY
uniref:Uncharacterized protein n=1 Tax=Loigolactobacillus rennini TaxID=238013 RepID=A0A1K2I9H9_9LACO|nr:hypothetical protein LREN565_2163 [Loigolactobacillus rennini]